jgi:predicted outer membrane repeat protein
MVRLVTGGPCRQFVLILVRRWWHDAHAQDCSFINNTVVDNFGGAIYADSSLLSMANSSFTLNRCASVGGVGGALASEYFTHFLRMRLSSGLPA